MLGPGSAQGTQQLTPELMEAASSCPGFILQVLVLTQAHTGGRLSPWPCYLCFSGWESVGQWQGARCWRGVTHWHGEALLWCEVCVCCTRAAVAVGSSTAQLKVPSPGACSGLAGEVGGQLPPSEDDRLPASPATAQTGVGLCRTSSSAAPTALPSGAWSWQPLFCPCSPGPEAAKWMKPMPGSWAGQAWRVRARAGSSVVGRDWGYTVSPCPL